MWPRAQTIGSLLFLVACSAEDQGNLFDDGSDSAASNMGGVNTGTTHATSSSDGTGGSDSTAGGSGGDATTTAGAVTGGGANSGGSSAGGSGTDVGGASANSTGGSGAGSSSDGGSGGASSTGGVGGSDASSTGGGAGGAGASSSEGGAGGSGSGGTAGTGASGGTAGTGASNTGGDGGTAGTGGSGGGPGGSGGETSSGGSGPDPEIVEVELEVGDCMVVRCPEEAPYVTACDIVFTEIGLDPSACVAVEPTRRVFIKAGLTCAGTSVESGFITCSSEPPAEELSEETCIIHNKEDLSIVEDRCDCPGTLASCQDE